MKVGGVRVGEGVPGQPPGEDGCFAAGEPREFDLGGPFQHLQADEEVVQGMVRRQLLAPQRRRHEQRDIWRGAQEVVEELQGLPVEPLEVVGDEQERPTRGADRPVQRIVEPLPLLSLRERLRVGKARHLRQEFREESRQFREARAIQLLGYPIQRVRAEPFHDRPVGERAFRRIRPCPGGRRAAMGAPRSKLLDESSLADPRLAGYEE